MFRKLKRYFSNPYYALGYDLMKICPNVMSDRFYIRTLWRMAMGYDLDLKNPKTFNEKLQWLKLHDHNPLYTTLVDKLRVKDWVSEKIGAQYVIPTLATYNSVDEIDIDKLPNQFVLKCNHDSSSVIVCKDKSLFDIENVKIKLERACNYNYYWNAREWPYKHVKPCIFAEQYMYDDQQPTLIDYKFWCFEGVPKVMYCSVKNENTWENYFDMDFSPLDINHGFPKCNKPVIKPTAFDEMKQIISNLSISIPFVRIDFYEVQGQVLFGEFTFYDYAGFRSFQSQKQDLMLGDMIHLPI